MNEQYNDKKQKIYQNRQIVFIFVCKLFRRAELRDKINVIEHHNRVTTRNIMFRLSLWKNLQVRKVYIIFVAILRSLKDPTVPRYWAKSTGTGYKEWRFAAAWTNDIYTISDKKWYATNRNRKKSRNWYNDEAYSTNTCLISK